jgi:hypothetical protein
VDSTEFDTRLSGNEVRLAMHANRILRKAWWAA